ncbi:MAG: SMP-30/gluconolactonase/LRE family protein [Opitutaceae bacterium]|nr:SMP-30/gluconolactonase/LRE family protein [Opitutaceae bacterium]
MRTLPNYMPIRNIAKLSWLVIAAALVTTETTYAELTGTTGDVSNWVSSTEWVKLGGSYKGSEGPQWIVENGEPVLYYAAHHDFLALKWSESNGLVQWRTDSPEATSFRPDGQGGYYVVEQTTRRVTRWNAEAKPVEILAERYKGKRLNRPNDLVVKKDGSLWFTDPPFMYGEKFPDQIRELEEENVYRLDPKTKRLTVACGAMSRPNGIAFSPDEQWIYLTDGRETKIFRCRVEGDRLGKPEVFADLGFRGTDGLTFDPKGNLWCGSMRGAYVYSPQGTLLGTMNFGEKVSATAFHSLPNGETMVAITTQTAAYVGKLKQ